MSELLVDVGSIGEPGASNCSAFMCSPEIAGRRDLTTMVRTALPIFGTAAAIRRAHPRRSRR
jgi:hypothetical protein